MATKLASMLVITLKLLVTNDALGVIGVHEMGRFLKLKYGFGQLEFDLFLVITAFDLVCVP